MNDFFDLLGTPDAPVSKIASVMVFRAIILKRGYAWSALMICFDSELFPQNFV